MWCGIRKDIVSRTMFKCERSGSTMCEKCMHEELEKTNQYQVL